MSQSVLQCADCERLVEQNCSRNASINVRILLNGFRRHNLLLGLFLSRVTGQTNLLRDPLQYGTRSLIIIIMLEQNFLRFKPVPAELIASCKLTASQLILIAILKQK